MPDPMQVALEDLPPLRKTLLKYGIYTKKSLGQHFLFDMNLTDKIAGLAGDLSQTTVLEVGPGPGGLTRSLLKAGVGKLIVIERDDTCMPVLHELKDIAGEKLTLIHDDALQVDYPALFNGEQNVHIVANLPYNVGTELLFTWLEHETIFSRMVLMFQKEVAERITAEPDCKDYGKLSVMAQWLYQADMLFDIPPEAFFPPPKVTSSVIALTRRDKPLAEVKRETLRKLLHAVFNQRRKMLRASLRQIHAEPEKLLAQAGIDPTRRPESLDIASFCALANALDGK